MKNELFKGLLKSMHEMDRIVQGELAPGRVIRFTEPEVKQIRMNTGPQPEAIYRADWYQLALKEAP